MNAPRRSQRTPSGRRSPAPAESTAAIAAAGTHASSASAHTPHTSAAAHAAAHTPHTSAAAHTPHAHAAAGGSGAERVQQMLSGVRAAGLKLTPQRVAIVRALAGDPTHPTAQEIFDRLQSSMPTMSFATVYNTLDALTNAGLCGSLSLSPGPARFDPNMAPHHHAVCDGCGLVRDVPRPLPDGEPPATIHPDHAAAGHAATSHAATSHAAAGHAAAEGVPALLGFEVRAVEHIYRGLCASCAARAAGRTPASNTTYPGADGDRHPLPGGSHGPAPHAASRPLSLSETKGETHGHDQPQRNQDASEPQGRLRG